MVPEIEKDLVRWGRRRWIATILVILGLHFALLYWAATPPPREKIHPALPEFTYNSTPSETPFVDLNNPLLFAAAHWDGFSGSAWMQKPRHPNPSPERLPPAKFLAYGKATELLPTSRLPSAEPGAPSFRMALPTVSAPSAAREYSSSYTLEGELAQRGLATPLNVPLQNHTDVLGNSVVQVAVDADGTVISARLVGSSGVKRVDQEAVVLARQARFNPAPPGAESAENDLTWGKLNFRWFTVNFGSTNAPAR